MEANNDQPWGTTHSRAVLAEDHTRRPSPITDADPALPQIPLPTSTDFLAPPQAISTSSRGTTETATLHVNRPTSTSSPVGRVPKRGRSPSVSQSDQEATSDQEKPSTSRLGHKRPRLLTETPNMRVGGETANRQAPTDLGAGAANGAHNGLKASIAYGSPTPTNGTPAVASSSHPATSANGQHTRSSTFHGHGREELTRILIQSLGDLGYGQAAEALSLESGYALETPYAAAFRTSVLQGDWPEAEALLMQARPRSRLGSSGLGSDGHSFESANKRDSMQSRTGLALVDTADVDGMFFLIRRQKFLEHLEHRDRDSALHVLRQELTPLRYDEDHVHSLSSLIMCSSPAELRSQAEWDGAAGESRQQLLAQLSVSISPSAMIPRHRLAELLHQVKQSQILNCQYHNTFEMPSLYTDHVCQVYEPPFAISHSLQKHSDEVWFLQFSHDGTRLATCGKDSSIIIYETTTFKMVHHLNDHRDSVTCLAWSPDDTKLISGSQDHEARLYDTRTGICLRVFKTHTEPVTCAAWAPDGKTIVTGSLCIKAPLCIWPADAPPGVLPIHNFTSQNQRVQDCDIGRLSSPSTSLAAAEESTTNYGPVRLVTICADHTVNIYDYARREKINQIALDNDLTSLTLSLDCHEMLINGSGDEVWLVRVVDGHIIQKFGGKAQTRNVIKSCFGGAREGFVVSGGENSMVTVWHRHTGRLLKQLAGHRPGCVNAVAWNTARPWMFASAGDDNTVKVWVHTEQNDDITGAASMLATVSHLEQEEQNNTSSAENSQVLSPPPQWASGSSSGHHARSGSLGSVMRR